MKAGIINSYWLNTGWPGSPGLVLLFANNILIIFNASACTLGIHCYVNMIIIISQLAL